MICYLDDRACVFTYCINVYPCYLSAICIVIGSQYMGLYVIQAHCSSLLSGWSSSIYKLSFMLGLSLSVFQQQVPIHSKSQLPSNNFTPSGAGKTRCCDVYTSWADFSLNLHLAACDRDLITVQPGRVDSVLIGGWHCDSCYPDTLSK